MAKWIIYTGPLVMFALFSQYHFEIYSTVERISEQDERHHDLIVFEENRTQQLAKFMIFINFGKLLLETMFMHRMAGRMISLNRTLW
jgi:hypothetical protein